MSVSTIRAVCILLFLVAYTLADLPSCARAKCVHCAVDFIDRMCPTACAGCKTSQQTVSVQRPPQPPPAFNHQPQFTQSVNTRQVSNEDGPPVQAPAVPQQSNQLSHLQVQQPQQFQPQIQFQSQSQQTLQQQQPVFHIPLQPQAQPVQFGAPVYQGSQIPYPQVPTPAQTQTSTLAPLVEPPKVSSFDPNLSRQPADLAQPLPEYQIGQVQFSQHQPPAQAQFQQQSQQGFGLPQTSHQQGYGQQVDSIFNQPNPFQMTPPQQGQNVFGAPGAAAGQPQSQQAAFNPFQPFLQQANAALDPFNLFNLNANPLAANQQGISGLQTQQQYGQVQHQGSYLQNYNNQSPQLPTSQPPQQPQQQQQYIQQYNQQYNQQYQQFQQPQQQYNQQQQQAQQSQQGQYGQQPREQQYHNQNSYQPQPAPQQQQLPVAVQQQVQQPVPQQPLPQPAAAASIDSRPVNYEKYVDPGKGTPLIPAPQVAPQCPRQPGWQPCITKGIANERFQSCCSRLGEGCAPLCNYDATLATMQLAVLTGRCPLSKVGDVMICASGYQDASQCCEAYGVFEPGYEHCRPYCNPSAGLPQEGLLTEKYKCLVKLSHIQQCFFVSQKP